MVAAASSWREPAPPPRLVEVRCRGCGKLLCRIETERARIEAVCPRCRRMQTRLVPDRR